MNIDIIEKPKININEEINVTCSSDIVKIKDVQEIRNAVREHLLFIGLDNKNNVRNISLLGIGTTCSVIIDSKEIIRIALCSASDKVVLIHNHPSNDLEPSEADLHLTNVTNEMLKVFNIKLQDHIIVTEKDYISIDKIQKISKEKNIDVIDNLEKALLLEENQKLKQQIEELRMSNIELKFNVISAEYVGSYNDTTVYNVEISLNGEKEFVTLERKYEDMKSKYKWEIFSNFNLKEEQKEYIIQVVSGNPPIMSIDASPTIYSEEIEDSVEEIITSMSDLDHEHYFTVARVMQDGKCVELHYDNGKANIEYGVKKADDLWENELNQNVNWFNLDLTDEEILQYLNKEFDEHFCEKEYDFDY